jgi:hypothetical protein
LTCQANKLTARVKMNNIAKELEAVAIKRIAAKLANLDANDDVRMLAWFAYSDALEKFQKKHNIPWDQLKGLLTEATADVYNNSLKSEVFGYAEVSA